MSEAGESKSFPVESVEESIAPSDPSDPKVVHKKDGRVIVLIPQPSDDPDDPLVSGGG